MDKEDVVICITMCTYTQRVLLIYKKQEILPFDSRFLNELRAKGMQNSSLIKYNN